MNNAGGIGVELSKELLKQIVSIFRMVDYGRITFQINPESKTLNFSVETTHKLLIEDLARQSEN